jgi:ABC-type dipeptide/oligopeptide/nickel transport system permease subunit
MTEHSARPPFSSTQIRQQRNRSCIGGVGPFAGCYDDDDSESVSGLPYGRTVHARMVHGHRNSVMIQGMASAAAFGIGSADTTLQLGLFQDWKVQWSAGYGLWNI